MTRNQIYFALMAACIGMIAVSWSVVRLYSVTAAIIISAVALLIPPIAAIIANAGDEGSRRL